MSKDDLDRIGELLVANVRDPSVRDIRNVLLGRSKGDDPDRIRQVLGDIDDATLARFSTVIPDFVDQVIHNLCAMLEEQEALDLVLHTDTGSVEASRHSDGLAGELYGDYGWLARFGKRP